MIIIINKYKYPLRDIPVKRRIETNQGFVLPGFFAKPLRDIPVKRRIETTIFIISLITIG